MKHHNSNLNSYLKAAVLALIVSGGTSRAALIGHWTFDEDPIGSGGPVADSSGATVHNGVITTSFANASTVGIIGKAFDFEKDNGSDHVNADLGGDFVTGADPASISFWMNPESAGGQNFVFAWGNNSAGQNIRVSLETASGDLTLRYRHQGGFVGFDASAMTLGNGWHHVAAVVPVGASDVGDVIFYLDGSPMSKLVDDNDTLNVTAGTGGTALNLAGNFNGGGYDGQLDDVGWWNHSLSANDVSAIYNGGLAGLDLQQALAVPEPSSAVMILLAVGGLIVRRRKR